MRESRDPRKDKALLWDELLSLTGLSVSPRSIGDMGTLSDVSCMRGPSWGSSQPTVALVLTNAGVLRLTVQPAGRMPMNHCASGWRFIDLRRISVGSALVFAS